MIDQSRYGFIYKTTFSKTNMFYIGKRVIQNNCMDNTYLGSGTIISKLIKKHGAESFSRGCVVRACKKYLGIYRNLKWCLKSDYEKRENK